MKPSPVVFGVSILALAGVIAAGSYFFTQNPRPTVTSAVTESKVQIGGPFNLVDQDGKSQTEAMLKGKWTLVFFGYTYCPDFCPTTLASLGQTFGLLGKDGADMQTLFISVDPARDTPKVLKTYLATDVFPKNVIGLTGTQAQVDQAIKSYRAYAAKNGSGETYVMDHSTAVYIMNPQGKFAAVMAYGQSPKQMADQIRAAKQGR